MPESIAPGVGQIGWTAAPAGMGDHNDYCMIPAGGDNPVAGVCHTLGDDEAMPPFRRCAVRGGKVRIAGIGRFCFIEEPADAIAALYQPE